jgi:hypothetical protein
LRGGGGSATLNLFEQSRRSAFNEAGCRRGREGGGGSGGGGGGGRGRALALAAGRCRRPPAFLRPAARRQAVTVQTPGHASRAPHAARAARRVRSAQVRGAVRPKQAFWGAILMIMIPASGANICRLSVPAGKHQTPKARESRARHLDQRLLCLWFRA